MSIIVIYLCLPIMVLYVLNAVVPFWDPLLEIANDWLKAPE